jgi:NADH-quinone oxidoreductase subunit G
MPAEQMIQLTIDGQQISVAKGTTVYQAAMQLGIEIPIFCYHDRMPPFGACRMCLVEVEKMGKLQASCTLEAAPGMMVKTSSQPAVEGRKGIIELLLINHPLDCPICDRGGECPLQENALHYGPGLSRFFEEKRHFKKPLPLNAVLMLDRERCIVCARCTRFGDLIAGDNALELIERGYKTEVGTPTGQPAVSKFIGNTIMICPVGALTSNVYRFRARPWDNDSANSTCTLCPVGCSLILDARDGEIMRVRARENRQVNDVWLCDKGWFGYEYVSHPERLHTPYIRHGGVLRPTSWESALALAAEKFQEAAASAKLAGFGGNSLTVEEGYLFQKLLRHVGGVNHLDHRIGMPMLTKEEEGLHSGMETRLEECETLQFALLAGIDLTEEFPLIWLRLKQALNRGASAFFMGHYAPEIARHLTKAVLHRPGLELEKLRKHLPEIAERTKHSARAAIFVGSQYLNMPERRQILFELQAFCSAHPQFTLNIMEGQGNSMGARFAGLRPDLGPVELPLDVPGWNAATVLQTAAGSGWDFLYVAGCDVARKVPSTLWKQARAKLGFLLVQELFMTETAQQADLVLPALAFAEKRGSFINIEGRIQKLLPGKAPPPNIYSDGDIFMRLAQTLGVNLELDAAFTERLMEGRCIDWNKRQPIALHLKNAVHSELHSKLAATFAPALFDRSVRMQHNPHLLKLSKEPYVRIHPSEGLKRGLKTGDRVHIAANGNRIAAQVKLDKDVADGTAVLPLGFEAIPVHELGMHLFNGLGIEVEQ